MTAVSRLAEMLVWDNHGCMPLREDANFLPELERYRAAGVDLVSLNIGYGMMGWDEHVRVARFMRDWIAGRDAFALVATVDDILAAKIAGRLGIVFDVEGMVPIGTEVGRVETLYQLGVRWMLVAYNRDNLAGGGCMDEGGGLTALGRAIIDEMERVGMVLCLSHASARTIEEAIDRVRNPPIFSHANPAGDTAHPRNVDDRLMRACAAKGGVIGLSGIGPFLGASSDPVGALLRQLRYVIDLVGSDHVGLGLDYVFDRTELDAYVRAHPAQFPADLDGRMPMVAPEAMPAIADGLAGMGLGDDAVRDIMGSNWLRVARTCWR